MPLYYTPSGCSRCFFTPRPVSVGGRISCRPQSRKRHTSCVAAIAGGTLLAVYAQPLFPGVLILIGSFTLALPGVFLL